MLTALLAIVGGVCTLAVCALSAIWFYYKDDLHEMDEGGD